MFDHGTRWSGQTHEPKTQDGQQREDDFFLSLLSFVDRRDTDRHSFRTVF